MPVLQARGIELAWRERGEGAPVLLIHEMAANAAVWEPVAEAISSEARAISYDRRGWGSSSAPEGYRRTTVEEQSEDAAALIEATGAAPAVVCGAGTGGVVALDLVLRRPELIGGAVLIEPALLQLLPVATEALSEDRRRIEKATAAGESVINLFLSGGLTALGPGVARLPDEVRSSAREHAPGLIAELGLAAGWRVPLPRLTEVKVPTVVLTATSTPPLLQDASAALAQRLTGSEHRELGEAELPPHLGAPDEVAAAALALSQ